MLETRMTESVVGIAALALVGDTPVHADDLSIGLLPYGPTITEADLT